MNMAMKKTFIFSLIIAAVMTSGCAKFLNVNPKGETFDEDMFTNEDGWQDALYGVYNEIATNSNLYKGYLQFCPEVMSQNVNCVNYYVLGSLSLGDWYSTGPSGIREKIWADTYEAINHTNNIISHAESANASDYKHFNLYYGEALALRALLHFELTRYFGAPYWASSSFKTKCIPYVENYSFDVTAFSSWDETYQKIIRDFKKAEELLSDDASLVPETRTNSATGFTDARITHLNLYAVQALLARVYWTMNDMENAAAYAQKVIDSGKFSFRPKSAFVQADNGTLDLNETLFGLYIDDESTIARQYALTGTSTSAFNLASDAITIYEEGSSSSQTDYRLGAWFDVTDALLVKLVNSIFYDESSASYTGSSILGINVIRLPEMYYILAEYYLSSDNAKAVEYFDKVTASRGLDALAETGETLTADMLYTERRKEFYGEGLTYHDMKKLGKDIITTTGDILSGKEPATYIMPIPDSESEARENLE